MTFTNPNSFILKKVSLIHETNQRIFSPLPQNLHKGISQL